MVAITWCSVPVISGIKGISMMTVPKEFAGFLFCGYHQVADLSVPPFRSWWWWHCQWLGIPRSIRRGFLRYGFSV